MIASLSSLHVYPLKSAAPLILESAAIEPRGLQHDRRWMVIDTAGKFLTGRKHPRMTLIRVQLMAEGLCLEAPGMPELDLVASKADRIPATVWGSTVAACLATVEADAWISAYLGQPARFVHMDNAAVRSVDPVYARAGDEVSFADGFPLLLISQSALDALNDRLAVPVPMLRFRPNLVVSGTEAHAEDGWRRISVGEVEFDVVKPCTRCVFTTVDPDRGEFDSAGEPLRTLMTYRRGPSGVTFGQNLIPRGSGRVRVGDPVVILD
jgi:uncharacterized protein YcbX